jgi:2-polyprenyl-6-methoxyphenol hydroxylase-like FAD-dependent oxidoreductase
MHGVALKTRGHNVLILERSRTPDMHSLGAGLNAGPDVQAFMDEYDRTGQPYCTKTTTWQMMDRQGNIIFTGPLPQAATNWDTLYYRLRANFDGLRSTYCEVPNSRIGDGKAVYMDGSTVHSIQETKNRVRVSYRDLSGQTEGIEADLVIAADGPNSTIRQILLPDVKRDYVGPRLGWKSRGRHSRL